MVSKANTWNYEVSRTLTVSVKNNYFLHKFKKNEFFNLKIPLKSQISLFAFEIEAQKRFCF